MRRRKMSVKMFAGFVALLLIANVLTGCGQKAEKKSNADDPVRFVSVKYNPLSAISFAGEAEGCAFDNRISFKQENKISVDFNMTYEDETYNDHFIYECTQEEIDKIQVAYQSVAIENNRYGDNAYRDTVYLTLTYVLALMSQDERDEADRMLNDIYNDALNVWEEPQPVESPMA